jgi:assimilatory nitrate reductase catalytic subunit
VLEKPTFLQGVYSFTGAGLNKPTALQPPLSYAVPADKRTQTIYFRAGNATPELIYVLLLKDGKPMRYFPIGAKAAVHVPLAVVEDLQPDSKIDVVVAAAEGISGSLVLDIGFMEF